MKEREIIAAAFDHIAQLELIYGDSVPARELQKGFIFENEVIHLQSANGIFKPKQFDNVVISVTTTISRTGSINIYKDYEGDDGSYHYAFEKPSTGKHRNQYLINNYDAEVPFIYFKAVAPAVYQCIWPCFIENVDHVKRFIKIIVGEKPRILGGATLDVLTKPKEIQARYYVRESKSRGHQAEFREEVLKAYGRKCAISGLPEDKLLQAAHIIPDAEYSGIQTVRNGIALNYLHHKAYDSFLIGIDTEYTVHVSDTLRLLKDGPLLKHGILEFDNKRINLPRNRENRPDQDLLSRKFEKFTLKNLI
jgi:putative restriction endonuclease